MEVTPKRVLYGRKFVGKSHTKLFGQVCETSGKNPSHARKFACSYTYVQGLAKNIFAEGPKVAKFNFHHSKLRKQLFCKKFDGKMSNFKILGGLALPFWTREADLFGLLFDLFTNKHIINNIFEIYLLKR